MQFQYSTYMGNVNKKKWGEQMIKVDGRRTNLEGGDELLQRELTLLIAVMKSRLESKGQNDAEADAFVRLSVEKGAGDLERLRQKAQIAKDRENSMRRQ